ncbi:hypothetical protein B484DRAFT_440549, partial [Ochromonadaceae sp. CCMP2298]
HKMADEVPENSGGIGANDRLAGADDTPVSPMVGGQPNPSLDQERGHVYTPAELAAMHDRDETHQIRCAGLLTDLTAFCAGCSLEPVAVMIAHGAAVRRQLDEFTSSQHVLQERLAQAERERDSLKSAADIAER